MSRFYVLPLVLAVSFPCTYASHQPAEEPLRLKESKRRPATLNCISGESIEKLRQSESFLLECPAGADGFELYEEEHNLRVVGMKFSNADEVEQAYYRTKEGGRVNTTSSAKELTQSHLLIMDSHRVWAQDGHYAHRGAIFIKTPAACFKDCFFTAPDGVTFYPFNSAVSKVKYIKFLPFNKTKPIFLKGAINLDVLEFKGAGNETSADAGRFLAANSHMEISFKAPEKAD